MLMQTEWRIGDHAFLWLHPVHGIACPQNSNWCGQQQLLGDIYKHFYFPLLLTNYGMHHQSYCRMCTRNAAVTVFCYCIMCCVPSVWKLNKIIVIILTFHAHGFSWVSQWSLENIFSLEISGDCLNIIAHDLDAVPGRPTASEHWIHQPNTSWCFSKVRYWSLGNLSALVQVLYVIQKHWL